MVLDAPYVCREAIREIPGIRWGGRGWLVPEDAVASVTAMLQEGGVAIHGVAADSTPPRSVADWAAGALREYQQEAVGFVEAVGGGLLALPMGAGKTLCAIRVAERRGRAALVICPAMVKSVWQSEIRKWTANPDIRICSTRTVDPATLAGLGPSSWAVANYEILDDHKTGRLTPEEKPERAPSPWVEALAGARFGTVILDEAHNIKSRAGARTSAVKALSQKMGPHLKLALTGTPIWNRPSDIWSLLDWIQPGGRWGTFWGFAKRYAAAGNHSGYGWDAKGVSHPEELAHRIRWVMFRRQKADILGWLPPKQRQVITVTAETAARRISQIEKRIGAGERVARSDLIAALHREGSAKVQAVAQLAAGCSERVVAFVSRRDTADALGKAMRTAGVRAWVIHGEHPQADRDAAMEEFSLARTPAALVATYGVAGVGIDLSCAAVAVMVDLDYVPSVILQAEDRLHRPGQQAAVSVFYVCVADSADEDVARMLVQKLDQQTAVLGEDAEAEGLRGTVACLVDEDGDGQKLIQMMLARLSEREGGQWAPTPA